MRRFFNILFQIFTPVRLAVIVVAAVFFMLLIFGDQGIMQLHKLILMKKQLVEKKTALKRDIDRLSHEKELLNDDKHLEFVIRDELGFIKPGEIIFQEKDKEHQ
jgi:cell division protein FtsB